MEKALVGILMGSDSDLPTMEKAAEVLKEIGVPYEMDISSAHRLPEKTAHYAKTARDRGLKVLIAGAGMAAHLAGALARCMRSSWRQAGATQLARPRRGCVRAACRRTVPRRGIGWDRPRLPTIVQPSRFPRPAATSLHPGEASTAFARPATTGQEAARRRPRP